MDSWRAGCAATRTSGSEARAGETGRSKRRYRAPVRPYDLLRCAATSRVLGHRVMAPSTVVAKTLRRTLLSLPGRITRSARRLALHLPVGWPWAPWFELALARLRCVAYAT